jgi:AraC family transcriptional activator of pobA
MNKKKTDQVILLEARGHVKFPKDFSIQFHTHIFCLRGSFSFAFNDKSYTCKSGEFVFFFADSKVGGFRFSKDFKATILLVEKDFLNTNIPDQKLSIDSFLYSKENPVLYLHSEKDKEKVLSNFRLLNERYQEKDHQFYEEVLRRQMQLFILEMWHTFAKNFEHRKRTVQSGTLYERFMQLLQENCMKEREVRFYAKKLNITAKYLNYVSKKNTGVTASDWIQRYARERIILLLQNKHLNVAEIADEMNFSSRSFFTRYVKKLLDITPSEFRNRLG